MEQPKFEHNEEETPGPELVQFEGKMVEEAPTAKREYTPEEAAALRPKFIEETEKALNDPSLDDDFDKI